MQHGTNEWWFPQYAREVCSTPLLTKAEELKVARAALKGSEKARERMICSNVRLVVKMALGMRRINYSLYDLLAEGTKGLIVAVDRFDPERGTRFSTYAAYWIRQSIKRYIDNNAGPVRTPIHSQQRASRMRRVANAMAQQIGREPSIEELAVELGMDSEDVERSLDMGFTSHVSLDAENAEGMTLTDVIPGEDNPAPYAKLETDTAKAALLSALNSLSPIERRIICCRYGIGGGSPETLEIIGQTESLTRERIRQIQERALRKLRRAGNWPLEMFNELKPVAG